MLQRAGVKAELRSVTDGVGTQNVFAASLGKEPRCLLFTNAQFIFVVGRVSFVRKVFGQEACHDGRES